MSQPIVTTLPNGLTVMAEPREEAGSVAAALVIPCGSVTDPEGRAGLSALTQEYLMQGAGPWNRRQLAFEWDRRGLMRHTSLGRESGMWVVGGLPPQLEEALNLLATVVLEPTFPEDGLEHVRAAALERVAAVEDQPMEKLFLLLGEKFFPHPLGRPPIGRREDLQVVSREEVIRHYHESYLAGGAVMALSGPLDWTALTAQMASRWGALKKASVPAGFGPCAQPMRYHMEQEGSQMQIGLAYPSVAPSDPDYLKNRILLKVLSGGMSSRLFTEVREKRGLVYHVHAAYKGLRGMGAWFCYAGTTPDKTEETLEVLKGEVERLRRGISPEEFETAKTKLMAALLVQGEVMMDRAADMAEKWFLTGRWHSAEDQAAEVKRLTLEEVNAHAAQIPVEATVITLGPTRVPAVAMSANEAGAARSGTP